MKEGDPLRKRDIQRERERERENIGSETFT